MFQRHYHRANAASIRQLPSYAKHWLLDKGSLTTRLIQASKESFEVKVVFQGIAKPLFDEARALAIKPSSRCLIREVQLCVDGETWVYARSVVPLRSISGKLGFLKKLQNSALGALLFKDPYLTRSCFEIFSGHLSSTSQHSHSHSEAAYSRRSIFKLKGQPLLVAETFLPACKL
ncbi:MAG: chorismate lyase [Sinobacterium sp.]|nr:chorismate lyase [Sinobacterium sp.]